MKKVFSAVMHIKSHKLCGKVAMLGTKVVASMTGAVVTFPDADPTTADLGTEVGKLVTFIGTASSKLTRTQRDKQSLKVFNMLKKEIRYVNNVADGDKETIELSGFDASEEPAPRPIPGKVVIKSVDKGAEPSTAKVKIVAMEEATLYIVQITTTPDVEESFRTILTTSNSRKIIIGGLARGQEYSIRIAAGNTHGQGDFSEISTYLGQ